MSVIDWDSGIIYADRDLWRRLADKLGYIWRRYIPHLVWEGQEIDVVVLFNSEQPGHVWTAKDSLGKAGIDFDGNRLCWRLDYSLRGPISVTFKGLAKNPEARV